MPPRFYRLFFLLVLFIGNTILGDAPSQFDHSYRAWDSWLKGHVKVTGPASTVDYKKAKAAPELLKGYLSEISLVTKPQFEGFKDNEKLAFLINAYNAFTIQLILDNYPVKSIKDIGGLFKSAWKKKFFTLLGEEQHLDGIEHGMIREMFQEPRIHFAVVCASVGCPQLRNEAFLPTRLDKQLADAATNFLTDSSRNRYDTIENKIYLSMIFKWYRDDFKKKNGTVNAFVAEYIAKDEGQKTNLLKAEISYLDYDWSLNETR